jgi:hypothetical protein
VNENKVPAAILAFALWSSRPKATAEQIGTEDWRFLVSDYIKILSELNTRGSAGTQAA